MCFRNDAGKIPDQKVYAMEEKWKQKHCNEALQTHAAKGS
jgi:hypothetical protein